MTTESPNIVINGRIYPMWQQFVQKKAQWIGGILEDHDMGMMASTKIKDIVLKPNGTDSAWFGIEGEDFDCGADVQYAGILGGEEGWITFAGYGGHMYRIKTP